MVRSVFSEFLIAVSVLSYSHFAGDSEDTGQLEGRYETDFCWSGGYVPGIWSAFD